MDLRDRLERMAGGGEKPGRETAPIPVEEVVAGEVEETERGPCYRVRTEYPERVCRGDRALHGVLSLDSERICVAGKDERLESFDVRSSLFLDAETTGLAGGTGTYPFLIGVGYFMKETFVVDQLFMRDYDEEGAILSALAGLVGPRRFIVTYNGKSFDVPLIEGKMIINGLTKGLGEAYNLDLLHAARRIWGRSLPDCRLNTIEECILGLLRGEDIPGDEIPERYFDYVRSGDASGLRVVFEHNRNDILTLPVLLGRVCKTIGDADSQDLKALDLYSIGRVYDSMKRRDETLLFYTQAVKLLRGSEKLMVECRLGMVYKRLNRWEDAVSTWTGLLGKGIYEPYEELAKYYEHVSKELARARDIVQDALESFGGTRMDGSLRHRLTRIEKKLSSGGGVED